jgi:hypothetical protein
MRGGNLTETRLRSIEMEELQVIQSELQGSMPELQQARLEQVSLQGTRVEYRFEVRLGPSEGEREKTEKAFPGPGSLGLIEQRRDRETGEVRPVSYERAHIIGHGFGIELPVIVYAPEHVNQKLQNLGAEEKLRALAQKLHHTADVFVEAHVLTQPGTLRLGSITYIVRVGSDRKLALKATIHVTGTVEKPRLEYEASAPGGADFVSLFTGLTDNVHTYVASADPTVLDPEAEERYRRERLLPDTKKALKAEIAAWKRANRARSA